MMFKDIGTTDRNVLVVKIRLEQFLSLYYISLYPKIVFFII